MLGVLLYLYDLDGFLNWGYNFWFTQHSLNWHIDPYQVVDAGRAFCGGGAFMVYPEKRMLWILSITKYLPKGCRICAPCVCWRKRSDAKKRSN
ncbi:MAG: glycoside hydrolase domain-containing protein [Victivallales bacterium]